MNKMLRTPTDQIFVAPSLDPKTRTASANGASVDRSGYTRAVCVLHVGAHDRGTGDETLTLKVQESSDASNWSDIPGASVQIAGDTIDATKGLVKLIEINLSNPARLKYLRAVGTAAGTTPSTAYSVHFLLVNPNVSPISQTVVSV